jgi:hypothetical protein
MNKPREIRISRNVHGVYIVEYVEDYEVYVTKHYFNVADFSDEIKDWLEPQL